MGPAATDTGTVLSAAHTVAATDGTPGAGTSTRTDTKSGTTNTVAYFTPTAAAPGNVPTTTICHASPGTNSEHEHSTPPS